MNFTANLLRLIAKADPPRRRQLELAFPEAVEAYEQWHADAPAAGTRQKEKP